MWPSGEILLRGPTAMSGYYAQPDETARVFENDGCLHTGDIAELQCNGAIRVIARIKNIAKNACGGCIYLEALERIYSEHPLCTPAGVCVLVHPHRSYVVALMLTDERRICAFMQREPALLQQWSWPNILQEPLFHRVAATSLVRLALRRGVRPRECVRAVNGGIHRRAMEQRYRSLILKLFQEDE